VIHGDYRKWANITTLDSVTNYEFYKGLHSSHNDGNYFEAAHTLNRQFGPSGMYKDLLLYNFADNHDVNRISSVLNDPADIYPLHILMFMAPGIPSLYYGSEAQLKGVKARDNDFALRPEIDVEKFDNKNDLSVVIRKLWDIRKNNPALKYGNYSQIYVSPDVFAFCREYENKKTVVIVSRLAEKTKLRLDVKGISGSCVFVDALNGNEEFVSDNGRIVINDMWPKWGRVLVQKQGRA
jgi:glycosidase